MVNFKPDSDTGGLEGKLRVLYMYDLQFTNPNIPASMCALYSCICRLRAVNQARVEPQVKEFWPTFSTRSLIKRVVLEGPRVEAVLLSERMRPLSWIE